MLYDTHSHVATSHFAKDRADVLARARAAGLSGLIEVGYESALWPHTLELACANRGWIYAALGIHPNDVTNEGDHAAAFALLEKLVAENREIVFGIGETGLDYYRPFTPHALQHEYLRKHFDLARRSDLPIIAHVREAVPDFIQALETDGSGTRGVMHMFAGTVAEALRCVELGYYISIGGAVTFANAHERREVAAAVPLERLLVETDCPYITPVPFRGKRNEPAYVVYTAQGVAKARNQAYEEVAAALTANTRRLFGLPE